MTDKDIAAYSRLIESIKSKWIEFQTHSFTGKTFSVMVWTSGRGTPLGEIKWFGRWRRYAFHPISNTIFEWECQRMIADVCEKMTRDHNAKYAVQHQLGYYREYALAMKIIFLQEALDQANKNAAKDGKLGVLPQSGGILFKESKAFHKKVRDMVRDTGGVDLIEEINKLSTDWHTLHSGSELDEAVAKKIGQFIENNGYRAQRSFSDL